MSGEGREGEKEGKGGAYTALGGGKEWAGKRGGNGGEAEAEGVAAGEGDGAIARKRGACVAVGGGGGIMGRGAEGRGSLTGVAEGAERLVVTEGAATAGSEGGGGQQGA